MADPRTDRDTDIQRQDGIERTSEESIEQEREYDDATRGQAEEGEDIDPDNPEADIDRDDTVTD